MNFFTYKHIPTNKWVRIDIEHHSGGYIHTSELVEIDHASFYEDDKMLSRDFLSSTLKDLTSNYISENKLEFKMVKIPPALVAYYLRFGR